MDVPVALLNGTDSVVDGAVEVDGAIEVAGSPRQDDRTLAGGIRTGRRGILDVIDRRGRGLGGGVFR